ncbi:putative DNA-binding helix-turn-helix protein [Rhodococcus phage E3]|uniref:plasmid antitoxin with HTH domain n=1 Tax=Rhodococcus phage E3 TaxID=1007869 RepID=UPI0002C6E289|nr:plasmid antitoxin with HTH domain [Rhodococcus phage E3]AEQ20964.1 putative DNA-binding helix-turn-helix protein [Rhodococcus phage E3]
MEVIHPGKLLAEELDTQGITQHALAKAIGVPPRRINEIVKRKRRITPDTALRLGRYFGVSAAFWLNMQSHHDIERRRAEISDDLRDIMPIGWGPSK